MKEYMDRLEALRTKYIQLGNEIERENSISSMQQQPQQTNGSIVSKRESLIK
jgi:hypothetical protein